MPLEPSERRDLQVTAEQLARWQGQTDAHIQENSRRLDAINGSIEKIEQSQTAVQVEVVALKTKVAFYSALGGLVGAGIVSIAVTFATGGG